MLAVERQSRILQTVRQRGSVSLEALSDELGVSASTVRRDVELLEANGEIQRTHGGAIWVGEKSPPARPYAFDQRRNYQPSAKQAIALAARKLVSPGQTILIDGGTTTCFFAEQLRGISLQIVTNSLPIAEIYQNDDNVELILTGGLLYPRYGVMLGPTAEAALDGIHAKTLFFSVAGIHDALLYNQNLLLVTGERKMMQQAQQVVLLADSSKFGQQALCRLGDLSEVDIVVSDNGLSEEHRQGIRQAGCELLLPSDDQKA